ncbi:MULTISPECIES: DMT family transporter [Nitrospirillum]|uniref:Drug/metabolite transporter (DMT)-like permease n=1 Tax=Nitrospirillum amazonense TaxID=28077 RepID=A0A560G5B3_9PROT|nr:DMT family transporter [Nitrospirillum amazonense]MEC4592834.1 DMT family transporter [Nitrospirillum amazonense]TWB29077.1 drug/metabolite transporter (DMT)-like permease [Nitrospirillum amazonense]
MTDTTVPTPLTTAPTRQPAAGFVYGLIGVIIFSGSLPVTKIGLAGLDANFLSLARAALAGMVAAGLLAALRPQRPSMGDLPGLAVVAGGAVIGFPLLSALALHWMPSTHAVVFSGLLPISTAVFGALRGGDRPRATFWLFSCAGAAAIAAYALAPALRQGGLQLAPGDGLMILAVIVCGLAYAEGARLSRHLGGWPVICWALVLSLPLMAPLAWATFPADWQSVPASAWMALGYVTLFSMLIGFFFWYHGLGLGGTAAVGQIQLLQPFCSFGLAAVLLGEPVGPAVLGTALVVVLCVAGARRAVRR